MRILQNGEKKLAKITKANRFAHNEPDFIDKAWVRLYNLTMKAFEMFRKYEKCPKT